jgi:hypothetical protein
VDLTDPDLKPCSKRQDSLSFCSKNIKLLKIMPVDFSACVQTTKCKSKCPPPQAATLGLVYARSKIDKNLKSSVKTKPGHGPGSRSDSNPQKDKAGSRSA